MLAQLIIAIHPHGVGRYDASFNVLRLKLSKGSYPCSLQRDFSSSQLTAPTLATPWSAFATLLHCTAPSTHYHLDTVLHNWLGQASAELCIYHMTAAE